MLPYTYTTTLHLNVLPDGTGGTPVPVLPGVQVTEDEEWVPNISAQLSVPAAYAVDARTSPRARLVLTRTDPEGMSGTTGTFQLVVRRCVTDYVRGTADLTLESPDILLLGTTTQPGGAGVFETLAGAVSSVYNILDPSRNYLTTLAISPEVTNAATPLVNIVGEANLPKWTPPEPAVDYLTRIADAYRCRFRMDRDGTLVAYRQWGQRILTIAGEDLLSVEHETDSAKFYNYAVVWHDENPTPLAERRAAAPAYRDSTIGRRVNFHRAPTVDTARMDRVMRQGETWQVTALEDGDVTAGDQLTIDAPHLPVSFTEVIRSVTHTSDGVMTMTVNPPVIGEPVP